MSYLVSDGLGPSLGSIFVKMFVNLQLLCCSLMRQAQFKIKNNVTYCLDTGL